MKDKKNIGKIKKKKWWTNENEGSVGMWEKK